MMFPRVPFNLFSKASKILSCLKSHYGTHVVKMYLLFWQLKIFKVNMFKSLGIFHGIQNHNYKMSYIHKKCPQSNLYNTHRLSYDSITPLDRQYALSWRLIFSWLSLWCLHSSMLFLL